MNSSNHPAFTEIKVKSGNMSLSTSENPNKQWYIEQQGHRNRNNYTIQQVNKI